MQKLLIVQVLLLLGLLTGCATADKAAGNTNGVVPVKSGAAIQREQVAQLPNLAEGETQVASTPDRKVLYSATLQLRVKNPDSAAMQLGRIADRYNGYVSETGSRRTIIRVESKFLNSAVSDVARLGKMQSKNLQGQDVTEQFADFQLRLESAEKAREKYLELLEDAETVAEAVLVEKELERLNETIELLKGKITRIEHLAEFSTITVHLLERKKPGVLGYVGLGLYYSVKWLFVRN